MSRWKIGLICWFVTAACFADATRDLHLAARSGDLDGVKQVIEAGLPADSPGRFGITALSLAAQADSETQSKAPPDKSDDPAALRRSQTWQRSLWLAPGSVAYPYQAFFDCSYKILLVIFELAIRPHQTPDSA